MRTRKECSLIAIFAIALAIGGLFAWRASPLYSLKATLKVVAVLILLPLVVWSAVRLIDSPALSRSVPLQATLAVIAYMVVTTGLSVTIIRITDHHVAQLPPAVQVTSHHRHKIVRWCWRLLVFLLIAAIAAIAVPASWQWLPLVIGGFPLIIGVPLLAILYMMARRKDLGLTEIRTTPWVHWQYSAETWQAWAANQRAWMQAQLKPVKWVRLVLAAPLGMAMVAFGPLLDSIGPILSGEGASTFDIAFFSGSCSLVACMMAAIIIYNRNSPARIWRHQLLAPPEMFFGDEGAFVNGEYVPWTMSGRYLISATLEPATAGYPPHISGVVLLIWNSFVGSTTVKLYCRVPIPQGRQADLATLQTRLDAACAAATIHLA